MATAVADSGPAARGWKLQIPDRLPSLSGQAYLLYRLIWPLCAILALVSLVLAYPYEQKTQETGAAFYGAGLIDWRADAHGARVSPFSAEARRKGVRNHELVVAVNGQPAPTDERALGRLLAGPDGTRLTVTLKGESGRTHDVELMRSSNYLKDAYAGTGITFQTRRWIEFGVSTAASLLMLAAAALLFFRRPRDSVAALLALAMAINVVAPTMIGGDSMSLVSVISHWLSVLLFFAAVLVFPDGRFAVRWWPVLAGVFLVTGVTAVAGHWDVAMLIASDRILLATMIVVVGALTVRYVRSPPDLARQQMKFAVLGFVAVVVFAVISQLLTVATDVATDEGVRAWIILVRNVSDALTGVASAAGLLVALLRYRLYDADTVIGRSAAYGVLTLGFVALFAGAEKLAELIGEHYFEHSIGVAAGAVGAAVAAAVIVPLHNRVHSWAERRFQKPLIRLRDGLPDCVADLRESAPLDQLLAAVMSRVEAGVRSTREAVLLVDGRKVQVAATHGTSASEIRKWRSGRHGFHSDSLMECDRRDPLFPMRVRLCIETADQPETIGWLLLGPRPDGSFFGKNERGALAHVAGPIARAIHITQLREGREREAEARLTRLEQMIAKFATAIGGADRGPAVA